MILFPVIGIAAEMYYSTTDKVSNLSKGQQLLIITFLRLSIMSSSFRTLVPEWWPYFTKQQQQKIII